MEVVMTKPGMKPAMKSPAMEVFATTPYKIKGLLGGMRMPSVPPVAETAAASSLRYPALIIPGIMILPMAAVVAGPEPLRAANIMQARIVTIANPPVKLPTLRFATSMISPVMPAGSMRKPAMTKPMVAIKGNWSMPI